MDPYEKFQPQAVHAIVNDFKATPKGRFLLVIPTGGGKTFTAIRSVGGLFAAGIIQRGLGRVVWVAHREELLVQARGDLLSYQSRFPEVPLVEGTDIVFSMISEAKTHIDDPGTRLVVLDEAHHGAAPTYLDAVFAQTKAGILGLTATPSRHDGKPLDFERESFSIGFPDLVKLGVLISPKIVNIAGIALHQVVDLSSEDSLELLNTAERDARIIQELLRGHTDYRKVIVYVGTRTHAVALYNRMIASDLTKHYESIAWVFGGQNENSYGIDRATFFEQEKSRKRSILINVTLLTEGYNDRTVNTVIMAAPCKSKLYCFQVAGRAVRRDPDNPEKKAFILEVVDELPNIRYRIDNRWLFSDVSDILEPHVRDITYSDQASFISALADLGSANAITHTGKLFSDWNSDERYSLLLFKVYRGGGDYSHVAVPITGDNRAAICDTFNYLSEKMAKCAEAKIPATQARLFGAVSRTPVLGDEELFPRIYEAMRNQHEVIAGTAVAEFLRKGYPWIQFVSFRYWQDALPADLLEFIKPCVNRDELIPLLSARTFSPGSSVVRLPLPVGGILGRIVSSEDTTRLAQVVADLEGAKCISSYEQCEHVLQALTKSVIPLESRMHAALFHIVKEDYEWKKEIA